MRILRSQSSLNIRLKTTDSGGLSCEESFILYVNNQEEKIDQITGELFNLDVDGDGSVTPLGDGLIVIRRLFRSAFAEDALTSKAISNDATRTTDEIHEYIAEMSDVGSAAIN